MGALGICLFYSCDKFCSYVNDRSPGVDIAILLLTTNIPLGGNVDKITMVDSTQTYTAGDPFSASGYGYTISQNKNSGSDVLVQTTDLKKYLEDACRTAFATNALPGTTPYASFTWENNYIWYPFVCGVFSSLYFS